MAHQAFKRASRLTKGVEFRRVFSRPVVSRDRYFRVLGRVNDLPQARLGMAVSVKVNKRAVVRNRLKRVVRESFRIHQHELTDSGHGLDFVVLPTRDAATICNERLSQALDRHWRKVLVKHRSEHRSSEEKN